MEEVLSNYFNKRLVFSVAQQISIEDYYSCVKRAFRTLSIHSNTQTHITQTLQTHSQEYWACVMRAATEDSSNLTKAVILCDRTWPLWALKSVKRSISSNSVTHTHTHIHTAHPTLRHPFLIEAGVLCRVALCHWASYCNDWQFSEPATQIKVQPLFSSSSLPLKINLSFSYTQLTCASNLSGCNTFYLSFTHLTVDHFFLFGKCPHSCFTHCYCTSFHFELVTRPQTVGSLLPS